MIQDIQFCLICSVTTNLVTCLNCNETYCNDRSGNASHIIYHLIRNKHKQVFINEIIRCKNCKDTNVFRLGIQMDENQIDEIQTDEQTNNIYCFKCKKDLNCLIEEKCFIDKISSSDQSKVKNLKVNTKNFLEIEQIPIIFNEKDYKRILTKLIKLEEQEEKLLKESIKVNNLECFIEGQFIKFLEKDESEIKIIKGDQISLEKNDIFIRAIIKKNQKGFIYSQIIEKRGINKETEKLIGMTLKFVWKEVGYSRMLSAIENLRKKCKKELFENLMIGGYKEIHKNFQIENELNESQKFAIKAALTRNITLIQGPPGTGKTITSAHIVKELVKKGYKVIVVAPTNTAVDQLASKISKLNVKVIRVLSRSREGTECITEKICLHYKIKKKLKAENKEIDEENITDDIYFSVGKTIVDSADVIACTCVTAGSKIFSKSKFTAVLIDEAVQATEPLSIIPLIYGCKKLILVGDHKQLGPLVLNEAARYGKLDQSLFQRLVLTGMTPCLLTVQYRMHPYLIKFPNKKFYDNLLTSGITLASRSCFIKPSYFYCSFKNEEISSSGTSYLNRGEAIIIKDMIKYLLNNGVRTSQIAVITFYEGQRCLLKDLITDIEITNVDGFQGREKDFIILSLVRSNNFQGIGFLNDIKRVNVAITRARYSMIIVGNPLTLKKNKFWGDLIKLYDEDNLLVEGRMGSFERYSLSTCIFNFKDLIKELDSN